MWYMCVLDYYVLCVLMIFLNVLLYFVRPLLSLASFVSLFFCLNGGREGGGAFFTMYVGGCGTSSFICHGREEGRRRLVDGKSLNEKRRALSYLLLKSDTQFVVVFCASCL